MYTTLFITLNFIIAFISDIGLNYLSHLKTSTEIIKSLKSYFDHYNSFILTGIYAGITVVVILLINILFSLFIFGFSSPNTLTELYKFLIIAVPLGYIADVLIYKYKVFGNTLDPYYRKAGAGLWGCVAFVFSIIFSTIAVMGLTKSQLGG